MGQLVPDSVGSFLDIGFGKGIILIELGEGHTDRGFVDQLAATRTTLLIMEEKVETHAQAIRTLV
jgi:hypothetical protein